MAKLQQIAKSGATQLIEQIAPKALAAGRDKGSAEILGTCIGLENYQGSQHVSAQQTASADLKSQTRSLIQKHGSEFGVAAENFTDAQIEAAAIVMMAAKSPGTYMQKAAVESYGSLGEGEFEAFLCNEGAGGIMDQGMKQAVATEYFTDQDLDKHMGASFQFNLQAARQDHFSETIMPTITADPSEAGLMLEVKKTMVHRAVRHSTNKDESRPFNRRNILDAATDPKVLEDESIAFVPYCREDGANADNFISPDLFAPRGREIGDYAVNTAPLAFGVDHNLLELSAHKDLVSSGYLDESDELNGRINLKEVFVTVAKKGAKPEDVQLIRLKTGNLARATFNKSQEGDGMELQLNFRGATFVLGEGLKDVDGNDVTAIDNLLSNNMKLNYTFKVNNNVNIQTGREDSMVSKIEITSIVDENSELVDLNKGVGKQIVDELEIHAVGYNYDATRSNANRRTKGLLIDSVIERERYKIQLGSPLTSRKPIGREDNSQAIQDLIDAARLRNSNQCITKILNVTETLKEVVKTIDKGNEYQVPSIEGIGRHYVRVWHDEANLNVNKLVSTLDSKDVDENLAAVILGVIREQVVRAIQESRFQPALEMLSGYTLTKPDIIIGTDVVIANWIERTADKRTLGDQFAYEVVTTNDNRFHGRLQWFFKVGDANGGINPLNFGNHIWIPELITDTNLTRNEGTANEVVVQPRNAHIVNCPITGVLTVDGIYELINSRTPHAIIANASLEAGGGDTVVVGDLAPEA